MKRVLVIKLGALGDFVLALAAMKRIRAAHSGAEITLLTTPPFRALGEACPYVDRVETDGRPRGAEATTAMLGRLRAAGYNRIYDLQTSSRTAAYHLALLPSAPEWSGHAPLASHRHRNPDRDQMHTLERQAEQLRDAGIWPDAPTGRGSAPPPDLSWAAASGAAEAFGLTTPYALLVPGASAHRPEKRWPAAGYAALARALQAKSLTVAVLGGPDERATGAEVAAAASGALDLTGRTDFLQLAALGAGAALAVGNDTGPTHLIAAAGAPTLALFGAASDPALCAPRGATAAFLRVEDLPQLSVETVVERATAMAKAP